MLIDLKNVDVYFEDGNAETGAINNATKTGAINNVAGYAAGATSIVVDGFVGIVAVGSRLTIDGVASYRVTSTVETTGNTTTINFTPALIAATIDDDDVVSATGFAVGAAYINVDGFTGQVPSQSRITIGSEEYTVTSTVETGGNTTRLVLSPALTAFVADDAVVNVFGTFLRIKVGDGTITWSEKKPREFKLDRGRLDQVRNADETPMEVSFQLMYEELTASNPSTDPPTPEDVLKRRGAAAAWVSANTDDPCAPYCINIRLDHTPPNCTSQDIERVILPMFYYEDLQHDPKAGMISVTGKCNEMEASVTRIAQ
jgi:hypothetical protein